MRTDRHTTHRQVDKKQQSVTYVPGCSAESSEVTNRYTVINQNDTETGRHAVTDKDIYSYICSDSHR